MANVDLHCIYLFENRNGRENTKQRVPQARSVKEETIDIDVAVISSKFN